MILRHDAGHSDSEKASRHSPLTIGAPRIHPFSLVPLPVRDLLPRRIGASIVSRAVAHSGTGGQCPQRLAGVQGQIARSDLR